jgi:hypothetical protein
MLEGLVAVMGAKVVLQAMRGGEPEGQRAGDAGDMCKDGRQRCSEMGQVPRLRDTTQDDCKIRLAGGFGLTLLTRLPWRVIRAAMSYCLLVFVLGFADTQEVVDAVLPYPGVIIASGRAPGHPRNAGTYSRVLAEYIREKRTLTLMEALRKMTLLPAQMLERSTPAARMKGRMQEGADADIVVFDPATIADRATFQKPMEPSVGVRYLVVGGTVLVDQGKIVEGVFPGRLLLGGRRRRLRPGRYSWSTVSAGPLLTLDNTRLSFSTEPRSARPFTRDQSPTRSLTSAATSLSTETWSDSANSEAC